MDIQQLKLLAGRIRGLLEQQGTHIGHSQALDTSAALPGLRNWPEVVAFPDRVAACQLDLAAAARLSYRLRTKSFAEMSAATLLDALRPPHAAESRPVITEVWPGGAAPGVYVTTSQDSIDALLRAYDEATDGAVVYAEDAGRDHEGTIDLGEQGISSPGLTRVPSGTLIVVGPMQLNQETWRDSAAHLEWACIRATDSGHRVALLVDTPSPSTLFEDLELMVHSVQAEGDHLERALLGSVSSDGALLARKTHSGDPAHSHPIVFPTTASLKPIPVAALQPLREAIAHKPRGLIILGSDKIEEHYAVDLVCSTLALTEDLGPAARIMARKRSTPAKDWMVPDALKALPMLPSIESAYALGYRRMIVQPIYTRLGDVAGYRDKVTFITGTFGFGVKEAMRNFDGQLLVPTPAKIRDLIAVLSVGGTAVENELGPLVDFLSALDLPANAGVLPKNCIDACRSLRWEAQADRAMATRHPISTDLRTALEVGDAHSALKQYLERFNGEGSAP